jgi:hypothetical protein
MSAWSILTKLYKHFTVLTKVAFTILENDSLPYAKSVTTGYSSWGFLMTKILFTFVMLLATSVANAGDGDEPDDIWPEACGKVEAPENATAPYPVGVCKVTIEKLEVLGEEGINDFYEIVFSDHTRQIWQPVDVRTARIMCVTAPCPYGLRNYTLQLVGRSEYINNSLRLLPITSDQKLKAGAYFSDATKPENFFFIDNNTTYNVPSMESLRE